MAGAGRLEFGLAENRGLIRPCGAAPETGKQAFLRVCLQLGRKRFREAHSSPLPMKSVTAIALPVLVATLGIVSAIGAVSKGAAELEPSKAVELVHRSRDEVARPSIRLELSQRSISEPVVKSQPAPKSWTSGSAVPRPSEVIVPRSYQPSLRGQEIAEEDLGRHVAGLAKLERSQIQALRSRYLSLPSRIESVLMGRELPAADYAYEQALEGLCDQIEAELVQSHKEYFQSRSFPYVKAGGTPLAARPLGNSQFTTQGLHVVGDWFVDAGFRSEDFPSLEAKLKAAMQMRIERVDFLDRTLNVH